MAQAAVLALKGAVSRPRCRGELAAGAPSARARGRRGSRPDPGTSPRARPSTGWREGSDRRRDAPRPSAPPHRRRGRARVAIPAGAPERRARRRPSARGARRCPAPRETRRRSRRDCRSRRSRPALCRLGRTRPPPRGALCGGRRATASPSPAATARRRPPRRRRMARFLDPVAAPRRPILWFAGPACSPRRLAAHSRTRAPSRSGGRRSRWPTKRGLRVLDFDDCERGGGRRSRDDGKLRLVWSGRVGSTGGRVRFGVRTGGASTSAR